MVESTRAHLAYNLTIITVVAIALLVEVVLALVPSPARLEIGSPAFGRGGPLPVTYSCEGDNVPPPLEWRGVPDRTRELAVVVVDHDAPGGAFVHWTVWGLDPGLRDLDGRRLPAGAMQGEASSGKAGWVGPCPPDGDGPHTYVFTLLALERPVELPEGAPPDATVRALEAAAVASASVAARFGR